MYKLGRSKGEGAGLEGLMLHPKLKSGALEQVHISNPRTYNPVSAPDKTISIDNLIQPPCGIMIVL